MLFWPTTEDNEKIESIRERIKYYAWMKNCGPRIYAWKAKYTNIRWYNHNKPLKGEKYPIHFNTCHYPFTSKKQIIEKLEDRVDKSLPNQNHHYKTLHNNKDMLILKKEQLHYDNGNNLIKDNKFNWNIYH